MQVLFTGVGEAFDETESNTSILLVPHSAGRKGHILLDCGFTAAHAFWRVSPSPPRLDAVWISHFHGDHFLGLPLLLLRFTEEGRTRPLTILGPKGVEEKVSRALELAYSGFRRKLTYPLECEEATCGENLEVAGFQLSFAESIHSQFCLAIRLDCEGNVVFYSGDGEPTESSQALARGSDLIVHESYGLEGSKPGHGSVDRCLEFARSAKAHALALVHLKADVRRRHAEELRARFSGSTEPTVFVPSSGDRFLIPVSPGT
jgi:ribonuclease BN (tRNA processing enzyme)